MAQLFARIIIIALCLYPIRAIANDSPVNIVKFYCQHDFEGGRLSSKTWDKISHLITWPDEPGWDHITVVSSFTIISSEQNENEATVVVEYGPAKKIQPGEQYDILLKPKHVNFKLKKIDGTWKIDNPIIEPHVSEEVVLKRLN